MAEEPKAPDASSEKEKKKIFNWDRCLEIVKLVATVWVAGLGTIVTMQFNERQNELNRLEAIAKMLPHLSQKPTDPNVKSPNQHHHDLSRDGAIWAIYRTANNRVMLRDLASLFPEDIYRVVSSTAQAGGVVPDEDALTAIQVASEKLAARYEKQHSELALRLYDQAVRLKQRSKDDSTPIYIVDLTDQEVQGQPKTEEAAHLLASINKLADLHLTDAEKTKRISTHHFQAKQLYKRVRDLGKDSSDERVMEQVAIADSCLGKMYAQEDRLERARDYFTDALNLSKNLAGDRNNIALEAERLLHEVNRKLSERQEGAKLPASAHHEK